MTPVINSNPFVLENLKKSIFKILKFLAISSIKNQRITTVKSINIGTIESSLSTLLKADQSTVYSYSFRDIVVRRQNEISTCQGLMYSQESQTIRIKINKKKDALKFIPRFSIQVFPSYMVERSLVVRDLRSTAAGYGQRCDICSNHLANVQVPVKQVEVLERNYR